MNAYSLLSGEVVEYPKQPATVNAFLTRVTTAVNDSAVTPAELLALVYGVENPILDTTSQPGRAIVTKAVFENPVYRILADLVGRKQLLHANQSPEDVAKLYTVSVRDAAEQLGITESSVRTAIANRKLSAVKRAGDWFIRPESIESYTVGTRGRKRKADMNTEHEVTVHCGSVPGGSLSVRVQDAELVVDHKEGNKVVGHFGEGWTRAAIKTTTKTGTRVFEIEPQAASDANIPHLELFVAGEFKVVAKHNSTKAAIEAWKQFEHAE